MRTSFRILLCALFMLVSMNMHAQNQNRYATFHDRVMLAKLHEIRNRLELSPVTFNKFRRIYIEYERRISRIKFVRIMDIDADSLSAIEAQLLIDNQLANTRRIANLREKYYSELKSVLTPQQLVKLYQSEAEIHKKVTIGIKNRKRISQ